MRTFFLALIAVVLVAVVALTTRWGVLSAERYGKRMPMDNSVAAVSTFDEIRNMIPADAQCTFMLIGDAACAKQVVRSNMLSFKKEALNEIPAEKETIESVWSYLKRGADFSGIRNVQGCGMWSYRIPAPQGGAEAYYRNEICYYNGEKPQQGALFFCNTQENLKKADILSQFPAQTLYGDISSIDFGAFYRSLVKAFPSVNKSSGVFSAYFLMPPEEFFDHISGEFRILIVQSQQTGFPEIFLELPDTGNRLFDRAAQLLGVSAEEKEIILPLPREVSLQVPYITNPLLARWKNKLIFCGSAETLKEIETALQENRTLATDPEARGAFSSLPPEAQSYCIVNQDELEAALFLRMRKTFDPEDNTPVVPLKSHFDAACIVYQPDAVRFIGNNYRDFPGQGTALLMNAVHGITSGAILGWKSIHEKK